MDLLVTSVQKEQLKLYEEMRALREIMYHRKTECSGERPG